MAKQDTLTPEDVTKHIDTLAQLWQAKDVVQFSQHIVDLRSAYKKRTVVKLLEKVADELSNHTQYEPHSAFKLFEIGDHVKPMENLYSGGAANRCLATTDEEGIVTDNNYNHSNRFITVQFYGETHNVVASASQFKKVYPSRYKRVNESESKTMYT